MLFKLLTWKWKQTVLPAIAKESPPVTRLWHQNLSPKRISLVLCAVTSSRTLLSSHAVTVSVKIVCSSSGKPKYPGNAQSELLSDVEAPWCNGKADMKWKEVAWMPLFSDYCITHHYLGLICLLRFPRFFSNSKTRNLVGKYGQKHVPWDFTKVNV